MCFSTGVSRPVRSTSLLGLPRVSTTGERAGLDRMGGADLGNRHEDDNYSDLVQPAKPNRDGAVSSRASSGVAGSCVADSDRSEPVAVGCSG